MRYVALLRGINVSGQKLIKMEALANIFSSMKFSNVKTYIQSGNVAFDAPGKEDAISRTIHAGLLKSLGYEVQVVLCTVGQLKSIVKLNPFKNIKEKSYVVFIQEPRNVKLPLKSKNNDVKVISSKGNALFCISREFKGRYGFPNAFVEKELKVAATTRNWNTVQKLSEM